MSTNPNELAGRSGMALVALQESLLARRKGALDQALALCQQSAQLYRAAAEQDEMEKLGLGKALIVLGEILSALDSNEEALDVLSEVADLVISIPQYGQEEPLILAAAALEKRAEILADFGRVADASESITRAIEFRRRRLNESPESDKAVALARSLNNRGIIFAALNRSEEALIDLDEAIHAYRTAIDRGASEIETTLSRALQARIAIVNGLGDNASDEIVSEFIQVYRRAVQLNPSILVDPRFPAAEKTVVEIRPHDGGRDPEKRRIRVMQGRYIELAEAIDAVRGTLAHASRSAGGSDIRFVVGPVELEFDVELQQSPEGAGGVRVMVMTGGSDPEATRSAVHRIKMTLTPVYQSGSDVLISDVHV